MRFSAARGSLKIHAYQEEERVPEETAAEVSTPAEPEQAGPAAAEVQPEEIVETTGSESSTSQQKQVVEATITLRSGKTMSKRAQATNDDIAVFLQQVKSGGFVEPAEGGMKVHPFHTIEEIYIKVFVVPDDQLTPSSVVEG